MNKKEENKNIHFKQLFFNPTSYFRNKYTLNNPKITRKNGLFDNINKNNINENEKINYNLTRKKLKLKPLNMNRSNLVTQFHRKIDDIIIPSNKTTQELIYYNKTNSHNTLLNYYHKSNRNLKIINFIKTNSFDQNNNTNLNLSNKKFSSNESFNNNISISSNVQNNNTKIENEVQPLIKNNQKQKSILETGIQGVHVFKQRKNIRKSTSIEKYEAEILAKKNIKFPRNLQYFHNRFFDQEIQNNIKQKNLLLKPDDLVESNMEILNSRNKNMENFDKRKLVFGSSFGQTKRNRRIINDRKKNLSVREIKDLSLQGFQRMKADKKRQFEIKLKKTNDEVLGLEKKLEELLEFNKQFFSSSDVDF